MQRRDTPPYGLEGCGPGAKGKNWRVFKDGLTEVLPGALSFAAKAGEGLIIETPGGSGFGSPRL